MTDPKDPRPTPSYTLDPIDVYDDEDELPEDMVEVPVFEEVVIEYKRELAK